MVCTALQQHRFTYNEAMPVESCTQALSDLALRFGEDDDDEGGMVRACLFWLRSPAAHRCPRRMMAFCCLTHSNI